MIKNDFSQAQVYTDLQGLEKLRREGRNNSPEALREVARQFEALMVQQILRSARASSELLTEGSFLDSEQLRFHQGMLDDQLSLQLTQQGQGFGLAEVLVRQLGRDYGIEGEATGEAAPSPMSIQAMLERGSRFPARRYEFDRTTQQVAPNTEPMSPGAVSEAADEQSTQATDQAADASKPSAPFESPTAFVRALYPAATEAARTLGVDPRVILAQAALETGWGRYMITREDGANSHNLFGIKADHRWPGERAVVTTLEYRGGVPRREQAAFRAYGSYAESFADYAAFLRSNPRYTEALRQAHDPAAFTHGLQEAGYATDPAYAKKIMRILQSPVMQLALQGLKKNTG